MINNQTDAVGEVLIGVNLGTTHLPRFASVKK